MLDEGDPGFLPPATGPATGPATYDALIDPDHPAYFAASFPISAERTRPLVDSQDRAATHPIDAAVPSLPDLPSPFERPLFVYLAQRRASGQLAPHAGYGQGYGQAAPVTRPVPPLPIPRPVTRTVTRPELRPTSRPTLRPPSARTPLRATYTPTPAATYPERAPAARHLTLPPSLRPAPETVRLHDEIRRQAAGDWAAALAAIVAGGVIVWGVVMVAMFLLVRP